MTSKKEFSFSNLKEYLPFIYIFLVCFGYFNKSFYFEQFDIDILYYLTIQELILMFIPVGSILILVAIGLIVIVAPIVNFIGKDKPADDNNEIAKNVNDIQKSNKTIDIIFSNIYRVISYLTSTYVLLTPMLVFLYFALSTIFDYMIYKPRIAFLLLVIWGFIFLLKLLIPSLEEKDRPNKDITAILIITILVFIIYTYNNYRRAQQIIKGEPEYVVKFKTKNQLISTNKHLLFFGQTNNYIFLRDICTNENQIYKKDDINQLIIKKS